MTKLITSKKTGIEHTVSEEEWQVMEQAGRSVNFTATDIPDKKLKGFTKIEPEELEEPEELKPKIKITKNIKHD